MEDKELQDYVAAFKRRKLQFIAIAGGIITLSLLVALFWPATYRSNAIILIEEQEIPSDLVRSTITTYAAQRLQTINQRVMTRANLERIIEKFDLYAKARTKRPMEEVIEAMRDDLAFEPISAEVIDPRTGQPSKATIAFSLSFDGKNPELVQQVANEITSLYLEENLKSRSQKTAETSHFLEEEAKQMGAYMTELEAKLAAFKEEHMHSLPDQKALTLQFIDKTERDLADIDTQVHSLEDRKFYLDGQLAQVQPESSTITGSGERVLSPAERLKALKSSYLSLSSTHSEKHPDIVNMRQEIEALEKEVGGGDVGTDQIKELSKLRTELASLRESSSDNHPDVIRLRKQVEKLEAEINRGVTRENARRIATSQPDNPAYITLQVQRDTTAQDIAALAKKRKELQAKLTEYEARLGQTPDVERQYLSLLRDYDNAAAKYRELKAKEMEAHVAEQLEKKSKGERFSIIEPPMLPEKPVKPNRIAIAFLGFVLALAGGAGYILLMETMDASLRGARSIAALTGVAPLAVIPLWQTDEEEDFERRRKLLFAVGAAAAVILVLGLVNWLWTPLDVLWFRGLRKLDQITG
ncbi:GumC family protein [Methyloterricola oryzae]|uniref:GumC family protein n=1 Tax=Methyloterricola oryzae TaxID=1495050 RepID=UPI0005EB4F88|nr:GNVR domain-containing protein [Methyloterricola oryzae]